MDENNTITYTTEEVIEELPSNIPDWNKIESYFKIIASATQANADSLKALKDSLSHNKDDHENDSQTSASDMPQSPRTFLNSPVSAKEMVTINKKYFEHPSDEIQKSKSNKRCPEHPSDKILGSSRSALTGKHLKCSERPRDMILEPSNPDIKGSSGVNTAKGKSICKRSASASVFNSPPLKLIAFDSSRANHEGSDSGRLEDMMFSDVEDISERVGCGSDLGDLQVIGAEKPPQWYPSPEALSFYVAAADIELKGDDLTRLKEEFSCDDQLATHFSPPKIPGAIWADIKATSSADVYKQTTCFKAQENLYLALKPMLTVLESLTPNSDERKLMAESIQLVCSANLQFNRFRRALIGPYIKREFKKPLMATPVLHNNLFGEGFEKEAEDISKEQNACCKLLSAASASRAAATSSSVTNFRGAMKSKVQYKPSASTSAGQAKAPENQQFFRGKQEIQGRYYWPRGRGRYRKYRKQ